MKYLTALLVSLLFASNVFATILPNNMIYHHEYCTPTGNDSNCYNTVITALTNAPGEIMSNLIVQNEIFSDNSMAQQIVDSGPTQLFTATSSKHQDATVASTLYANDASIYYVDILNGVYDVKTGVSLKRRASDGYYNLTIVSGSYALTQQASRYNYESIATLSTGWIQKDTPAYYDMITLASSYLSRLYTKDQLKVLLAKAALVGYGASYSSTCDYFGSGSGEPDPALNAIDKKLCKNSP